MSKETKVIACEAFGELSTSVIFAISTNQNAQCTLMRFSDLKETSTDTTADSIFEKFR